MKVYALTSIGKEVTKNRTGNDDEMKVLQYLRENRTATEDELSVVGGERYVLRRLKGEGLIKELTLGGGYG